MTTTMATMTEKSEPRERGVRHRSLDGVRGRIIATFVILLGLATLISIVAVRQILVVQLDNDVTDSLQQEVDEFRRLADEGVDPTTGRPFGTDVERLFRVFLARNVPSEGEELITIPRRGQTRFRFSEQAEGALSDEAFAEQTSRWRRLRDVESGEIDSAVGEARYLAVPVIKGGEFLGTFAVVNFIRSEREEVDDAVTVLAGVSLGVLAVASVVAFFAAGRVLAPLRSLRDAARSVSARELTRRIDVSGNDEIAELGRTYNGMMDRLEQAFRSQREFVRDAGHELRTPITIVRGHLELLAQQPERLDETLVLATDELDRMGRFVEDLLLLAKSERPNFLQLRTINLEELAQDLLSNAGTLASREWRLDGSVPRVIVGDPQRLTQAVIALADNAIHQTEEGDEIGIGITVEGSFAHLWVRDSGRGVATADKERIFERFQRGRGDQHYEGSGLGLAIVRAIAEAHGGWVELYSEPGEGARFEIVVPVDPDDVPIEGQEGEDT